jgi:hypothetical protein
MTPFSHIDQPGLSWRTKDAKITASLTEGAEAKILFVCPEKLSGQTKRLFWRIGLSPILKESFFLRDLSALSESRQGRDERAVKLYHT